MSIRTRILGSVAAATLTAGLGLALPAGASAPAGIDDFQQCVENEITPGDDCYDHPVEEPKEPEPTEPEVNDDPKPGRPDFTG